MRRYFNSLYFSVFFVLLGVLFSQPSSAVFLTKSSACIDAFNTLQSKLEPGGNADSFEGSRDETERTVKVVSESSGRNGGKLRNVLRVGKRWGSVATTLKGYDPQGDPRWFIESVGPKAAQLFGYEVKSDKNMTVPDVVELDGAIARVNNVLKRKGQDPIGISFYGSSKSILGRYNRLFSDEGALPIAESENHFFHDISYHVGVIFLPPKILEFAQKRIKFERSFIEYLKNKYQEPIFKKRIDNLVRRMQLGAALDIDNGTGLLTPGIATLARKKTGEKAAGENLLRNGILSLTGQSALINTRDHFERFSVTIKDFEFQIGDFSWIFHPLVKALHLVSGQPTTVDLKRDLIAFLKIYNANQSVFDPKSHLNVESYEDICREITERRDQIREAAIEALAENSLP